MPIAPFEHWNTSDPQAKRWQTMRRGLAKGESVGFVGGLNHEMRARQRIVELRQFLGNGLVERGVHDDPFVDMKLGRDAADYGQLRV